MSAKIENKCQGAGDEVTSPPLNTTAGGGKGAVGFAACESGPDFSSNKSAAGIHHTRAHSANDLSNAPIAHQTGPRRAWDDVSKQYREGGILSARKVFDAMDNTKNQKEKKGLLKAVSLPRHCYFPQKGDQNFEDVDIDEVVAENVETLERGDGLFSFACKPGDELSQEEQHLVDSIVNMTVFKDETKENGVPPCNVFDEKEAKEYIFMINNCAYMLPGMQLSQCTPQLLASYHYQKNAQTKSVHVWDDVKEEDTFRITKTIIRFVFSITVQFRCSWIDDKDLEFFSRFIGIKVDSGLLMERTKRTNTGKPDATAKTKSVLLYTKVDGGLLVHNLTIIMNSCLPTIVARLVNNLGSMGVDEVAETAWMTRKHLREEFNLK